MMADKLQVVVTFLTLVLGLCSVSSALRCQSGEYPIYIAKGTFLLSNTGDSVTVDHLVQTVTGCQELCDGLSEFVCVAFGHSTVNQMCNLYPVISTASGVTRQQDSATRHYDGVCSQTPNLDNCESTNTEVELLLMVDGSGSICDNVNVTYADQKFACNNWVSLKRFLTQLVQFLTIGPTETRVALVTFHSQADLDFNFDQYDNKQDILDALDALIYKGGNTMTYDALRLMQSDVFPTARQGATKIAFVVTDGHPTIDAAGPNTENATEEEARNAQESDIIMYSVGITTNINERWLQAFSSAPHQEGTNYFTSADFENLLPVIQALLSAACIKLNPVLVPTTPEPTEPASTSEPEPEGEPELTPRDVYEYFRDHPEYVAMVGMGFMILLLFITIIAILCCFSGRAAAASREEEYEDKS